MARLPIPGGDDGTWGAILNDYLSQEHNPDGTQKTVPVAKGGTGATDAPTARTNLGLGSAATDDTGDFATAVQGATADSAVQPSDLGGAAVLDVGTTTGTVAAGDDSRITGAAQKASNLSDLADTPTARTNLGLGSAATNDTEDFAPASHVSSTETHGATGAVVGTTNVQTLTNKTFDSFTNHIEADAVHVEARNVSGVSIPSGTPVYISGYNVDQEIVEIELANGATSATMPAIGITRGAIANGSNGEVVRVGRISGLATNSWAVGTLLYVGVTAGTLTATVPSGAELIQPIATVLRSHATLGIIQVADKGVNDLARAKADTLYIVVVDIGADNTVVRPSGAICVYWRGSVAPLNALPGDLIYVGGDL